jgi:hypothetical protein
VSQPQHEPARPAWTCEDCGEEWPCRQARSRLRAETGGGTELAMLMWEYFEAYFRDIMAQSNGAFERFIAWTRSPPRSDG